MNTLENILIRENILSEKKLEKAKKEALETNSPLEKILTKNKYLSSKDIILAKSKMYGLRIIDLNTFPIALDAISLVPENVARDYNIIPVIKTGNTISIATSNPMDIEAIESVELHSHCRVETVLSNVDDIHQAIETYFGVFGKISELLKNTEQDQLDAQTEVASSKIAETKTIEGPISQIIKLMIIQAVNTGASDIHLEPLETRLRVRLRIDGILQETFTYEKKYQAALISSAKLMCSLDIAEKRIPQDGRLRITVKTRPIDLRVSTFPAMHGEKMVFRILDKESANVDISQLGITGDSLELLLKIIKQPHGIFLVTGPTGSGKTTTLYSVLNKVNTPKVNIITMEDPVEFDLDTVNQGQVNVKAGLTFAKGLRAMMRQDPDIVMIGEIRDSETAEISIQAALTGHLVLSTLHTNSAPGAVVRLVEMGVEPFLLASSLLGVLAQRLVRRLCPKCKKSYTPESSLIKRLGLDAETKYTFYQATGCRACGRTGYKGRAGIYELMEPTNEIRTLIVEGKSSNEIRDLAVSQGMLTLQADGIQRVISGITSIEEILRVAGDS
ncbi:MAG: ATPase, T2SS/T4P/T4SS family [Gammaproteobacteria bacterium]|nr:ATPase, T2SS/T4P/T4SS family [Gammaproteobacteria bacterium]